MSLLPDHRRVGAEVRGVGVVQSVARVVRARPPQTRARSPWQPPPLATFRDPFAILSIDVSHFAPRGAAGRILTTLRGSPRRVERGVAGEDAHRALRVRDILAPVRLRATGLAGLGERRACRPAAAAAVPSLREGVVAGERVQLVPRARAVLVPDARRPDDPRRRAAISAASGRARWVRGSRGCSPPGAGRTRTRSRASTGPRPPTARSRRSRDPCYARDAVCGSRQRHVLLVWVSLCAKVREKPRATLQKARRAPPAQRPAAAGGPRDVSHLPRPRSRARRARRRRPGVAFVDASRPPRTTRSTGFATADARSDAETFVSGADGDGPPPPGDPRGGRRRRRGHVLRGGAVPPAPARRRGACDRRGRGQERAPGGARDQERRGGAHRGEAGHGRCRG